ncbi:MAG: AsmA family protein, partial [Sedimenticolaceae bacterium]
MSPTRSAKPLRRMSAYLAVFVAALVGIYALVGFVLVPYLIQRMAPAAVAEHLQRELELHHVAFNPFTLRLTLQGLTLREPQGATLASIAETTIDLDAGPLLKREIWLSELQLIGPWVNLEIAADGELNLARLIADTGGDEEPSAASPPAAAAEPWYVTLERVAVRNGVLHV